MFEGVAFHVFVHTMLVPAAANVSGNVGNYTCNIYDNHVSISHLPQVLCGGDLE